VEKASYTGRVPKISAGSVAEHRAQQRRALVDAARTLLEAGDAAAVTFASVARAAGLARNSVYKYFPDRAALLEAVVVDSAPRWTGPVRAAMEAETSPEERVAAYVRAQLALVGRGEHAIARALAAGGDAAALRAGAARAHQDILAPLVETLAALGDDDPHRTALLLQGFVNAATRAVESGDDAEAVTERAVRLAVAALGALSG
jgi:AcrR family transcriptional regulator